MIEFFKYLTDKGLSIGRALTDKINVALYKPTMTPSGAKRMGINWKPKDTETFSVLRDLAQSDVLLTFNGEPVRLAYNPKGEEYPLTSKDNFGNERVVQVKREQDSFTLLSASTVNADEATSIWGSL